MSSSSSTSLHFPSFPFQSAQARQEPSVEDEVSSSPTDSQSLNRKPNAASISTSTSSSRSTHSPDVHPEAPSPAQAPRPVSGLASNTLSPAVYQENRGVPPSTYLSRIAPERDVADSLDALTARDLSIHLFNAFALKRRARSDISFSGSISRRPAPKDVVRKGSSKDAEVHDATADDNDDASDDTITYEQVGDPGWRPPKVWTAWPVRAEEVPREEREWEEDGPFAALRDSGEESSSGNLAELLAGHVLKAAKKRLREKGLVDREQHASSATRESGERSSSASSDGLHEEDTAGGEDSPFLAAEILADDDHAASILRPSIQHILSNLDKLLGNLHHARASYTTPKPRKNTRGFDGATSELTESNADISAASSNRKRRRPRTGSTKNLQTQNQDVEDSTSSDGNTSNNPRNRKRQRTGSSNRSRSCLNSHSITRSASRPRSESHPAPKSRSNLPLIAKFHEFRSHKPRYAPLDWSTVLGIASLSAFPSRVVDKAAKRCADLFDEGMKFRTLNLDSAHRDEEVDVLPDAWDNAKRREKGDSSEEGNADDSHSKRGGSSAQNIALRNIQLSERDATHGGVHVDGFLQPIQGQKWWAKKAKKRDPKVMTKQARKERSRKEESD
jgi:hypothetical protein